MTQLVTEACKTAGLADSILAVEMTGIYHKPVYLAFRKAKFDTRIVHPFASSHYRQPLHPDQKTDDKDLEAIFHAAIKGYGLATPPVGQAEEFEDVREVLFQGIIAARQEVAEATIVLHRPHKTLIDGKQRVFTGKPLEVRLVAARVVDSEGYILAEWTLLTNVSSETVDASQVALWYYWRWRIESFFKLLKRHGLQVEHWQQESGEAIARRLLVAAMACVVVWNLQRQETPEVEATKQLLVRLSGRRMKRNVPFTAPALLAGYFVMLSMCDLLEHTDYDLRPSPPTHCRFWTRHRCVDTNGFSR